MSLFDDILDDGISSGPDPFGPHLGFAGVLLCASACDGHIGDEEAQSLNMIIGQKKLYERLTSQQFSAMMDRLIGELKRGGPEKLLDKAYPVVPPELRECVFANAVDIVLADGVVEDEERTFIDELQGKLEIEQKRAKAIVQVMVYKNHG
ncbi:MAG: tellurite resistance TerB family protein [Pirellulaceae bacterium]|jgi:tellurite resistance protein|nr:tellurite resistance TerB family protein [Pirellulaceae bacterium]